MDANSMAILILLGKMCIRDRDRNHHQQSDRLKGDR